MFTRKSKQRLQEAKISDLFVSKWLKLLSIKSAPLLQIPGSHGPHFSLNLLVKLIWMPNLCFLELVYKFVPGSSFHKPSIPILISFSPILWLCPLLLAHAELNKNNKVRLVTPSSCCLQLCFKYWGVEWEWGFYCLIWVRFECFILVARWQGGRYEWCIWVMANMQG